MERAIVLGSDVDYYNAAPLRDKLNCPVFSRSALGELKTVKAVYVCGGNEEDVAKVAPNATLVNLSGSNRFETAANILAYLQSLRTEDPL